MSNPKEIQILGGRVRLWQAPDGFNTAIDSVLLAAACPAQDDQSVLDLGCGVGSAGFCILSRVPSSTLHGIDLQNDVIALARENAVLNDMADRGSFEQQNVLDHIEAVKNDSGHFDQIICNPPYMKDGKHLKSPKDGKAQSHGNQDNVSVQDWIDAALYSLKTSGSLTMIHRADQVDHILKALGNRFGATEIIPLWPKEGADAKRVIVRSVKGRKTPANLRSGLILHQENGEYTQQAENILREGAPIL